MASVDQTKTIWIKKGDVVNGKTVTKGYLALRSDKSKPFSGTVTGIRSNTTTTSTKNKGKTSVAVYTGGRNVGATAKREAMKSGSSAAAGINPKKASGTRTDGMKAAPKKSPAAGGGKGYGLGAMGKGTGAARGTTPAASKPKPATTTSSQREKAARDAAKQMAQKAMDRKKQGKFGGY